MEIILLNGTEKRLYDMVAPLVMNPDVIKQNNGYPFKTSKDFVWYIAVKDKEIAGFVPLKKTAAGLLIDNYYIREDNERTLSLLLEKIITDTGDRTELMATAHKRHVGTFKEHGFKTVIDWKKYEKMLFVGNKTQKDDETT